MSPPEPVDPSSPTVADQQTLGTEPVARISIRDVPEYDLGEVIGRGGMGEVVVAHHRNIGRDVALKRMRAEKPSAENVDRFLREAKIQARLDHPSIAPVHELGYDSDGLPYFTMKRVAGTTLAELLARRTERVQRFLRALVDVCLAVDLAHARGIVHRDLKPSNIMLGDYGEVYVLDWGVARILTPGDKRASTHSDDAISFDGLTQVGALIGTPGYMAPEQARGEPVGPKADVYSLGAILFEILSGEPLHKRDTGEALASTLSLTDGSPSRRRPDQRIAPELDALCINALAMEADARPTARELADAIQGYLDGDRDVERRRTAANNLTQSARTALDAGDRGKAMRAAGRALALDPGSTSAAEVVMSLVVNEPTVIPAEVEDALHEDELKTARARSRRALIPYASIFLIAPMVPFLTVSDWPLLIAFFAAFAMMLVITWANVKVGVPIGVTLAGHTLTALLFSRLVGPFVITPMMLAAILLSATSLPWLNRRWWAVALWTTVTVALPFVLEWLGVFAPTWTLTPMGLVSHGSVFDPTRMHPNLIVFGHIAAVVLVAGYARRVGRDRSDAQRRMFLQAWHLKHLLPKNVNA